MADVKLAAWGKNMKINFPNVDPVVMPNGAVTFPAQVDGQTITVEITEEALREHFGAKSRDWHDLIAACISGKRRIRKVARRKIPLAAAGRYLLVAADF
jgi:hypothetical protein